MTGEMNKDIQHLKAIHHNTTTPVMLSTLHRPSTNTFLSQGYTPHRHTMTHKHLYTTAAGHVE